LDDRDDYGTIKMVKRIMTMSTTRWRGWYEGD
jgi:hypothetical protein